MTRWQRFPTIAAILAAACGTRPRAREASTDAVAVACAREVDGEMMQAANCRRAQGYEDAGVAGDREHALRACVLRAYAPGSGETPESILGCARLSEENPPVCGGLWMFESRKCPAPQGRLALGAACGLGRQCASGYCDSALTTVTLGAPMACGRCAPRTPAGGPCTFVASAACEAGAGCHMRQCLPDPPPRDVGESCWEERVEGSVHLGEEVPCRSGLTCLESRCVRAARRGDACSRHECAEGLFCFGVCTDPPQIGDACLPDGTGPRCGAPLACDLSSHRCVLTMFVGEGHSCSDPAVTCRAGLLCGHRPGEGDDRCIRPLDEGAECASTSFPPCGLKLVCLEGRCQLDDPGRCSSGVPRSE